MALELNGSQYATLPHESSCEFPDGDWSVSMWFYVASLAGSDRMGLLNMGSWNAANSFLTYIGTPTSSNPNDIRCWVYDAAADNAFATGNNENDTEDAWRAITFRKSSGALDIWLDGALVDDVGVDASAVGAIAGSAAMNFGLAAANIGTGLIGRLADVAKWSRALSDTEIGNLHNAESGVRAADLSTGRDFLYEFDGDAAEALGGTTLTLTGSPSTAADGPFAASGTTESISGTSAGTSADSATDTVSVSISGESAGTSTDTGTDTVGYSVFGTVTDGGTPEEGAEVYLIDLSDDSLVGSELTDASGEYRFDSVPAGSYHATVYVSGKTARSQNVTVG